MSLLIFLHCKNVRVISTHFGLAQLHLFSNSLSYHSTSSIEDQADRTNTIPVYHIKFGYPFAKAILHAVDSVCNGVATIEGLKIGLVFTGMWNVQGYNVNSRALATALYNTNKSFRTSAKVMYNTRT